MNEFVFLSLYSLSHKTALLDVIIVFGAETLGWLLLAGLFWFLVAERMGDVRESSPGWSPSRRHVKEVSVIFFTALFAWLLAHTIKFFADAPRPFAALESVVPLFEKENLDSFPSGHATFFFALATGLYFYHKRLAYWYMAGALVIGLSRVIAGVHWPIDILAGYLLGGAVAYGIYYFYRRR